MTTGNTSQEAATQSEALPQPVDTSGKRACDRAEGSSKNRSTGRIVSSILVVACSVALLIFAVFFNKYIAYYELVTVNNVSKWNSYPILTPSYSSWLPMLVATLIFFVLGQIILIHYRRYLIQETVSMVLNLFAIATVTSLFYIFPFDFSAIPGADTAYMLYIAVKVALVGIAAVIAAETLMRFVKLIVKVSFH